MKKEHISLNEAINKYNNTDIENNIYCFITDISFAFDLPNTEAIKGKLELIQSEISYYINNLLKDENEKVQLYTKLTRLASVLTVIIFI